MKLHEAIEKLIRENKRPLTSNEIANSLNENKWYTKKDGSQITPYQIHGRVKRYTNIFKIDSSLVSLTSQGTIELDNISKENQISNNTTSKQIDEWLCESNFKSPSSIDKVVPNSPGIYCIRLKDYSSLPTPFDEILKEKNNNIIYIGIATQSLNDRLLKNELRAEGHGTFFRSIGAILGHLPVEGSLRNKANKNNYKFSLEDKNIIIGWINSNILVNWIELDNNLNQIESSLIKKYCPLLNIKHNPFVNKEFIDLRKRCIEIARG